MSAAVRSSDQFLCSICLQLFTEPVSAPCGHNFCRTCLIEHWDTNVFCSCPLCQKTFPQRPELSVNTLLSEMVLQVKQETENLSEQVSAPGDVSCDVCTDPKLKAVKSCLVCFASYCDSHLQPHLTVSGLKRHQLMEPVDNLEERVCPKHDKPLELYCRTDHSCVCIMCPLLEHQSHKFVSLKEEFDLRRSSLQQTQAQTQLMVEQRRQKVQEIQSSLELSQEAVNKETAAGLKVFTALIEYVQESREKFIERLQKKHTKIQKRAEDQIQKLEQEICELEKRSPEVEQLSQSEDHVIFIQRSTLPALKDWSKVRFKPQTFEGSVATALTELQEKLNEEINVFKTNLMNLEVLKKFAVDITLDPDTANPYLVLSEDLTEVHRGDEKKKLPTNPLRFTSHQFVMGKQSFSSGRFYFEVLVTGKSLWSLGVAQESIEKDKTIKWCPKNGVWFIGLHGGHQYTAYSTNRVSLSLEHPPEKVGVFVNYDEGLVSFYDVDTEDLIYAFTGCRFTEKILPILNPGDNPLGENSAPLILTTVQSF